MGLDLSIAPEPVANYIGTKFAKNIAFSCRQKPFSNTKRGFVGKDLTIEEGYQAARETCLNCLAQLKKHLGFS